MTTTWTAQSPDTMEGFMDTLTGFDELAIGKHFDGLDPYTNGQDQPILTLRALIFVDKRREPHNLTDPEAKLAVMSMTLGEANAYFVDEPEALDPDEPETPAGEGGTAVE